MAGPHLMIPMDTFTASNEIPDHVGEHDTLQQNDSTNQENCLLGKTPTPVYRHAAPSGPWPWMDFNEDVPLVHPTEPTSADDPSWHGYPQSSFPNWTESQVDRSGMLKECPVGQSNVYKVDVYKNGKFREGSADLATIKDGPSEVAFWNWLRQPREEDIRVRALFVKNMTKGALQMLGTKYNIEPFFFSSSTNWIPSRYQESLVKTKSDHITVVLPFIRVVDEAAAGSLPLSKQPRQQPDESESSQEDDQVIDTQSPLYLDSCKKYVLQDLLSAHMVRTVESSTIISYHPTLRSKTAEQLQSLINRTGRSVYWSKIFDKSKDPSCLFLCFMWYAMYEWDEVFEVLYAHINHLEQLVLDSKNVRETQHLHILQAHLLYYRTLLEDFRKSVEFVKETENPAMHDPLVTENERAESRKILERETNYLISEIERLESQRAMQVKRLKNVMDLAFATVNIEDSIYMKELTFATVRDSAAMKQISYLTMVFLPANFISNVFSMNVIEINPQGGETLIHYVEAAVALSVFASWITIALQADSSFFPRGSPVWRRAGWPLFYVWDMWVRMYHRLKYSWNEKRKTA